MPEVSVGWCFVLGFTNCIILLTLVSVLRLIVCHLCYVTIEKKRNVDQIIKKQRWIGIITYSEFSEHNGLPFFKLKL